MLKVLVIVLAIIGGIAILSIVGMGTMHFGMMGGIGGRGGCLASVSTAIDPSHGALTALEGRLST